MVQSTISQTNKQLKLAFQRLSFSIYANADSIMNNTTLPTRYSLVFQLLPREVLCAHCKFWQPTLHRFLRRKNLTKNGIIFCQFICLYTCTILACRLSWIVEIRIKRKTQRKRKKERLSASRPHAGPSMFHISNFGILPGQVVVSLSAAMQKDCRYKHNSTFGL